MKQKWGREQDAGNWPSNKSVWTIGAFCVALLGVIAIGCYRYMRLWTPLQQHYLMPYVGTPVAGAVRADGWYTLLTVVTRKGKPTDETPTALRRTYPWDHACLPLSKT